MSQYYERGDVIEQIILHLPFAYEDTDNVKEIAIKIADSCTPVKLNGLPDTTVSDESSNSKIAPAVISAESNRSDSGTEKTAEIKAIEEHEDVIEETHKSLEETSQDIAAPEIEIIEEHENIIEEIREPLKEKPQNIIASKNELLKKLENVIEKTDNPLADKHQETEKPKSTESIAQETLTAEETQPARGKHIKENNSVMREDAVPRVAADDDEPPRRGILFPVFDAYGRYCADKCSWCKEVFNLPHEPMNFCTECGADFRVRRRTSSRKA